MADAAPRLAVINQECDGGATAAAREVLAWGPDRGIDVRYYPEAGEANEASLLRDLEAFQPALIHLHCWYQSYPHDLPLRLPQNIPAVITVHDVALVNQYGEECWECYRNSWCIGCPALGGITRWRPNHRILERRRKGRVNSAFGAHLIHPSRWMQRRLSRTELSRLPGDVIPYGVDLVRFSRGQAERHRFGLGAAPVVLFAGHMYSGQDHRKGLPDLLDAWREVRREVPEATLALAGRHFLKGLPEGVISLGDIPGRHLPALYSSVDLFCLPSRGDNLPVAVLEAMGCELPIVGTLVGGIPEEVEDQVTGLLVPSCDPTSLARALTELLQDSSRRQSMGEAGRARARALFSRERSADLHEALYRKLIG